MVNFIYRHKKLIILFHLLLMIGACSKENPTRHLTLGNWYLQRGLLDEAIMEYREVSRLYGGEQSQLQRDEFQILGKAHLKLAIAYTKKGWWDYALQEAETCFELQPIKDHYDLVSLIKQRSKLEDSESQ